MTLNSSGPISLGGTTAGVSIEVELGGGGTTQISLNDSNVRSLAGVSSGAITMPTNFYGKSNTSYWIISTQKQQLNQQQNKQILVVPNNQNSNTNIYLTAAFVNSGIPGVMFWAYSISGSYLYSSAGGVSSTFSSYSSNNCYSQTVSDGITAYTGCYQPQPTITKTTLSTAVGVYTYNYTNLYSGVSSLAMDSSGYIYIGGTYSTCTTYGPQVPSLLKINSVGAVQWSKYYTNGSSNTNAGAVGLACDSTYIYFISCDFSYNYFTQVSLSTGALGFSYKYTTSYSGKNYYWDVSNNSSGPTKLAYNSSTGFAVAGYSSNGAGATVVSLLNTSGSFVWQRYIFPGYTFSNIATYGTTTIDNSGNVYAATWVVSNYIDSVWSANQTILIVKFNSSGTLQWVRGIILQEPSTNAIGAQSVSLEPSPTGDIVIGFEFYDTSGSKQYPVVIHYPASGSLYGSTYTIAAGSGYTVQITSTSVTTATVSQSSSSGWTSTTGTSAEQSYSNSKNTYNGGYSSTFSNL